MAEQKTFPDIDRRQSNSFLEQLRIFHALLGIGAFLLIQTASIAWWASAITQKVTSLEAKTTDRYTKSEALSNNQIQDIRINRNEKDIDNMVGLLKEINTKVDKLVSRV